MRPKREVSGPPNTRFSVVTIVEETGSTNADLLQAAEQGAPEGMVLVTQHQTAGRGRQGRTWLDQPGSALLVSWLLRPNPETAGLIPLVTGLSVAEALAGLGVESAGLKWPNDVLAADDVAAGRRERKLAGILAEATTTGPSFAVVVGMGMNLRFVGEPPPEVADIAVDLTSLVPGAGDDPISAHELLRSILTNVDTRLRQLEAGGRDAVLDAYRAVCWTLGRDVELETPSGVVAGVASDIDPGGGLVVTPPGRSPIVVTAGDAHHRS